MSKDSIRTRRGRTWRGNFTKQKAEENKDIKREEENESKEEK